MTEYNLQYHPVADCLPLLQGEDFGQLVEDIREHGQREPIWIYESRILDGRNRYRACKELGIDPLTQIYEGDDPLAFVLSLNLHRRHLTSSQRAVLALRVEALEAERAKERMSLGGQGPQLIADLERGEARDKAAEKVGTNRQYVSDAKRIARDTPDLLPRIEDGTLSIPQAKKVAEYSEPTRAAILQSVVSNGGDLNSAIDEHVPTERRAEMAVHYSSDSPEWYTPPDIIERTIQALGGIDLDPCSNSREEPNVPAHRPFTIGDDGLLRPWKGTVYMNPPYGREIEAWVEKLCGEYEAGNVTEAVALVPARTDTKWFRRMRRYPRCFVHGRLAFSGHETSAPFPNAIIYLGDNLDRFVAAFGTLGDTYILL